MCLSLCEFVCFVSVSRPRDSINSRNERHQVVFNDSVSPLPAQDGSFRHIFGACFLCGLFVCGPQLLLHTEASVQTDSGPVFFISFGLFIFDQFLLLFS